MTVPSDLLGHVPATTAYAVLAAAVLAESVLLVGAFVPTLGLLRRPERWPAPGT